MIASAGEEEKCRQDAGRCKIGLPSEEIPEMTQFVRGIALWGCLAVAAGPIAAVAQGTLELTSALGRKLYALPDDAAETTAKKNLAADPKNLALVLALSKAQAARRQYKEAVATDTAGLAIDPQDADL